MRMTWSVSGWREGPLSECVQSKLVWLVTGKTQPGVKNAHAL